MSIIPVSEIPTLNLLYKLQRLSPPGNTVETATSKYNDKICLIRSDITKLAVDAIVNAANQSLLGGGGVDGAIHAAAGPELLAECRRLNGCDTGDAKITNAYRLPCKKVIHAVGPVYRITKQQGTHASLLSRCYVRSLHLAVGNECRSIAFAALSTGIYGYPSEEAAVTAISAVKQWLDEDEARADKLERIVFCSFLEKDEKAYEKHTPSFFPPASPKQEQVKESATAATLPELPDVPTQPPAEEGQPETKRTRTDEV